MEKFDFILHLNYIELQGDCIEGIEVQQQRNDHHTETVREVRACSTWSERMVIASLPGLQLMCLSN